MKQTMILASMLMLGAAMPALANDYDNSGSNDAASNTTMSDSSGTTKHHKKMHKNNDNMSVNGQGSNAVDNSGKNTGSGTKSSGTGSAERMRENPDKDNVTQ